MSLTIEQAAKRMGMKPHREVRMVTAVVGGTIATTHDGTHTYIPDDGGPMEFNVIAPVPARSRFIVVEDTPPDPQAVPDGSADVITSWVGSDPDRAARALAVEQAKDQPRKGLVAALEKLKG